MLKSGPVLVWFGLVAKGGSSLFCLKFLGVAYVGYSYKSFLKIFSSFVFFESPFLVIVSKKKKKKSFVHPIIFDLHAPGGWMSPVSGE